MTHEDDYNIPEKLLEQIYAQGFAALPELIRIVLNTAMKMEREKHLGAGPYEGTPQRQGHSNGYRDRQRTKSHRITEYPYLMDPSKMLSGNDTFLFGIGIAYRGTLSAQNDMKMSDTLFIDTILEGVVGSAAKALRRAICTYRLRWFRFVRGRFLGFTFDFHDLGYYARNRFSDFLEPGPFGAEY